MDDTRYMHPVDLIDAATDLPPRKWKRYAAIAFMATFLLVPKPARRLGSRRSGKHAADLRAAESWLRTLIEGRRRLPTFSRRTYVSQRDRTSSTFGAPLARVVRQSNFLRC